MVMIPWWTRIGVILFCGFMAWMLLGCSASDDRTSLDTEEDTETSSPERRQSDAELYNEALEIFRTKDYPAAIDAFEEVERQHPYSKWATRAKIMSAYSAYKAQEYDDAVLILERFTKLHPSNKSTPYAYYLIALCYYDQISDVGRDQKMTENARKALREVVSRYPDSEYAQDAKLKLDLTEDHLAGKEMEVGRYYLVREEYLAAINRFKYVVEHFETTTHIPEALHRLVESYLRLGVVPEARKYAAVLGHNFPGSDWYRYSYAMLEENNLAPEHTDNSGWKDWVPGL